jgi:hypothetical protein
MTRQEMVKFVDLINTKFGGPIANALFLPAGVVALTIFGDTVTFNEDLDLIGSRPANKYYGSTCGGFSGGTCGGFSGGTSDGY